MPNVIIDLMVDRVDLVEEGANSAAFVELFKRREKQKMTVEEILGELTPEHAEVIKSAIDAAANSLTAEQAKVTALEKAKEDLEVTVSNLTKAKEDAEAKVPCECDGEAAEDGTCKTCGKKKVAKGVSGIDEEETLKGLPESMRAYVEKLKLKNAAAEEEVRKANELKVHNEAVAKAATLKSLPVEEASLVDILKSADSKIVDMLTTINAAINTTVLGEVGKSASGAAGTGDRDSAWAKIEIEAGKIEKSSNVTKQKAITMAIEANPNLYKDYLNGGAK